MQYELIYHYHSSVTVTVEAEDKYEAIQKGRETVTDEAILKELEETGIEIEELK